MYVVEYACVLRPGTWRYHSDWPTAQEAAQAAAAVFHQGDGRPVRVVDDYGRVVAQFPASPALWWA